MVKMKIVMSPEHRFKQRTGDKFFNLLECVSYGLIGKIQLLNGSIEEKLHVLPGKVTGGMREQVVGSY